MFFGSGQSKHRARHRGVPAARFIGLPKDKSGPSGDRARQGQPPDQPRGVGGAGSAGPHRCEDGRRQTRGEANPRGDATVVHPGCWFCLAGRAKGARWWGLAASRWPVLFAGRAKGARWWSVAASRWPVLLAGRAKGARWWGLAASRWPVLLAGRAKGARWWSVAASRWPVLLAIWVLPMLANGVSGRPSIPFAISALCRKADLGVHLPSRAWGVAVRMMPQRRRLPHAVPPGSG